MNNSLEKAIDALTKFYRIAGLLRVVSSVGRAAPLQGVGHRFDPCTTHQISLSSDGEYQRPGSSVG